VTEPRDWLLLFLAGNGHEEPLDPIRIQKGMFLLSMRGPQRDLYTFKPYDWGPFSSDIYHDLDVLEDAGLVLSEAAPGRTWRLYRTSIEGTRLAREFADGMGEANVRWLLDTRRFVTERSFLRLLQDIYAAYPEYAANSKLQ
jgi:uncharacterized protein